MEATTHLAQPSQPDPLQALIALGRVAGAVGAQTGAPVSAPGVASGVEGAGTSGPGSRWGDLTGDALVAAVELVEHAGRAIDSLRVQVAGEVAQRCVACDSDERLSTKYGQRTAAELIEYVAGVSAREARRRVRLSEQLLGRTSDTGLPLPPLFAQVGAALAAGDLGLEAAEVIVSELGKAAPRADLELLDAAECALVDGACPQRESEQTNVGSPNAAGDDDHCESGYLQRAPGLSADLVRVQARAWREALDPDGVQPREDEAVNRRDFWISSRAHNGLHAVRGTIPADVAARALAVFDACLSAKTPPRFLRDVVGGADATGDEHRDGVSGSRPTETRTLGQQRADVFAAMVAALTGSPEFHMPPAVMVTIPAADHSASDSGSSSALGGSARAGAASASAASAEAALAGRCCGIGPVAETGSISGVDDPVAAQTIGRMACDGGTQFAQLDAQGALVSLTTTQRVFSTHQRRAIAARDGHQCAIPGCRIPAHACEAHHVVPWQQGGKTHVGNGVLLCWWHHRHIDNGAWQITMCEGRPQIRPPQIRSLLHQTARRRR
ncbi:MAG: DUF222 domain-containing protein [Pseudoclavibacter sp.]